MTRKLIVTRHPGALEWLQGVLEDAGEREVLASARPQDVAGADVVGNLPMGLACLARRYRAVEFGGRPPRGSEYGPREMDEAGARLAEYVVLGAQEARDLYECGHCYTPTPRRWDRPPREEA